MKKRMVIAGSMAFAATALAASSGSATTYMGTSSTDGGIAELSFTTDGTIGILSQNNITDFSVNVMDGAGSALINSANGALDLVGSNLTATSTGLFFNFDNLSEAFLLTERGSIGDDDAFYCATASRGCFGENTASEGLSTQNGESPLESAPRTGIVEIASTGTSAVPEVATWAMMIGGIGMTGGALRRRRKVNVSKVSFA